MFWKIAMLVLFAVMTVVVGFINKKKTMDANEFVLGGRSIGPWLSAFAYGTSYFSATIFVGYAGQFGWNFGVSAFWIGIGNALIGSLLAWVVLGRRTRIMTKHLESATMPDFFAKRYDSEAFRVVSSIIIFIFLVPYTSSVYKGLAGLFAKAVGEELGISFIWCIVGMAVITGIFVFAGGYTGSAVNNFIQGIIMLVGIVMIVVAVLNGRGGFMEALTLLSHETSDKVPELNGAFSSLFGPDPVGLLSVVILTSLGTWGLPQMVHKFYAIKNEKAIKTGTVISTVFALIIAGGSYFMGGFGRLYYNATPFVADDIIPTMVSDKAIPDILIGVVLLVVLSASISTLSSLVLTSSSTFVSDFVKHFKPNVKNKLEFILVRGMCLVFIVVSVVIALVPNSVITSMMNLSWGALAGAFLGPFLFGLFYKKTTRASVWTSMLFGISFVVANFFFSFTSSSIAGAVAMLASLAIVPVVSLFTPKLDSDFVDKAFSCYDEKIVVPVKTVLQEK